MNTHIAHTHIGSNGVECVPPRASWPPAWLASTTPASPPEAIAEPPDVEDIPQTIDLPTVAPDAICRCGSMAWRDVQIHKGQTVRRDCAKCGRFVSFPVWYGET